MAESFADAALTPGDRMLKFFPANLRFPRIKQALARQAVGRLPRRSRSPGFETLEQRQLLATLVNGRFDESNASLPGYGWTGSGGAAVQAGAGVLHEDVQASTSFKQNFVVPVGALELQFTLTKHDLRSSAGAPPDAFEVALLNATTLTSLVSVVGLSGSDAFLNLQADGQLFRGSTTTVAGLEQPNATTNPDAALVVRVSLAGVTPGIVATLHLDLLGFGAVDSTVIVDNVTIIGVDAPPLTFSLASASDTGIVGDFITRQTSVSFTGQTDPLATVQLDVDNDGFDDSVTTAALDGTFTISNVTLPVGASPVRMRAGTSPGTTIVSHTTTVDVAPPQGRLIFPAPGTVLTQDVGYIDVQWQDSGGAGMDPASVGLADVAITGVTFDQVTPLENNTYRYFYGLDNDIFPAGVVQVRYSAGGVSDLAGNLSVATSEALSATLLLRGGADVVAFAGTAAALDGAAFSYNGAHSQLSLQVDWKDGAVDNIGLPVGSGGAGIAASHVYASPGIRTVRATLQGPGGLVRTDDVRIVATKTGCGFQNPTIATDVNVDNLVTPLDALLIIIQLNNSGVRSLAGVTGNGLFYDTDCDHFLAPLDALMVIIALNSGAQPESPTLDFAASDPSADEALQLYQESDAPILQGNLLASSQNQPANSGRSDLSAAEVDYLLGVFMNSTNDPWDAEHRDREDGP